MSNIGFNRGTLFVISAPSGAGKTSLVTEFVKNDPQLVVSISHTTRAPREGEVHGQNYFFVDEPVFQSLIAENVFIEHARVFDYSYGTSAAWLQSKLAMGLDVILEIDWQGFELVRAKMPCVSIFILPPSKQALVNRLNLRAKDKPEVIARRLQEAAVEVAHCVDYDYLVINDNFNEALADLAAIVRAVRQRTAVQRTVLQPLLQEFIGD